MRDTGSAPKAWARLALVGLAGGLLLFAARRAEGDEGDPATGDDGMPPGMVTYFMGGACPEGWAPATAVEGRLAVVVADSTEAGTAVGEPLGDQEDRAHTHDYAGEVTLTPKNISAANGGNDQGARAKNYPLAGTTEAHTSGLPFLQVQACVKQ